VERIIHFIQIRFHIITEIVPNNYFIITHRKIADKNLGEIGAVEAPERRRNILPLLWGFYRGGAPAYILSPLYGYCERPCSVNQKCVLTIIIMPLTAYLLFLPYLCSH
jgi:hypothetical protein